VVQWRAVGKVPVKVTRWRSILRTLRSKWGGVRETGSSTSLIVILMAVYMTGCGEDSIFSNVETYTIKVYNNYSVMMTIYMDDEHLFDVPAYGEMVKHDVPKGTYQLKAKTFGTTRTRYTVDVELNSHFWWEFFINDYGPTHQYGNTKNEDWL